MLRARAAPPHAQPQRAPQLLRPAHAPPPAALRRPAQPPARRRAAMPPRAPPRAALAAGSAVGAAAVGALGAWALYYVLRVRQTPLVRAGPTPLNAALLDRLPQLRQPYAPPVWAFNAWVQARRVRRTRGARAPRAGSRSPHDMWRCAR
jgi:hypothetical protein